MPLYTIQLLHYIFLITWHIFTHAKVDLKWHHPSTHNCVQCHTYQQIPAIHIIQPHPHHRIVDLFNTFIMGGFSTLFKHTDYTSALFKPMHASIEHINIPGRFKRVKVLNNSTSLLCCFYTLFHLHVDVRSGDERG